jgi:hypothetical protein
MCSTCKQRKLTVKRVVSKQFDAIKFPLFVGAHKKFDIDRSKAQRKRTANSPEFSTFYLHLTELFK